MPGRLAEATQTWASARECHPVAKAAVLVSDEVQAEVEVNTHRQILGSGEKKAHQPRLRGIPYLAPEIVLLFKAKHAEREKDAADFARALPMLEPNRRRWLADALRIVHPGHHWITIVDL